jgi:hypothetical protein
MTGQVPLGRVPESAVPEAAGRLRRTPEWAARRAGADPVDELAQRMGAACAGAVHAEEIAALLESEGLTDEQITGRYRHPDLFALAETLYARVPRAFPEPEPGPDPWRTGLTRCVLRGLTFALPGLAYVLGARWADGPDGPFGVTAAVAGWAVAALFSWGWNQGLAHRAGLLLLAGRRRDAARCLLSGGAVGAAGATAAALALTGVARPAPPLFAAGQALYMAAATTVLVLGGERLLLYVLAPLTPAAASGAAGLPSPALASGLTATVLAALWAAAHTARRPGGTPHGRGGLRAQPRRRWGYLPGESSGGASPPSEGGCCCRRRTTGPWWVARAVPRAPDCPGPTQSERPLPEEAAPPRGAGNGANSHDATGAAPPARRGCWCRRRRIGPWKGAAPDPHRTTQSVARVPVGGSVAMGLGGFAAGVLVVGAALAGELVAALSVSMGIAEWLLFRFRGRCLAALRGTGVGERFAVRSGRVLVRCLGGYGAALVVLAGVESAVLPGAAAWDAPHLAVLLALGCALWLALLLQSCGSPWTAAVVLSAAAATALALLASRAAAPGAALALSGAGAAAVLLAAAAAVTARVTTHR